MKTMVSTAGSGAQQSPESPDFLLPGDTA